MVHSKYFLERCQRLKEIGIEFEIAQGTLVSRGFADLGFEEFMVLSPTRLVSIYTGTLSNYSQNEEAHFFVVPTCDMMVDLLLKDGFEIASLTFVDQRSWQIKIIKQENSLIGQGGALEDALVETLICTKSQSLQA